VHNNKLLRLVALVVALHGPATAQVAILQIHIVEGEGAVHPPGSRTAHPLIVQVTDETGKPVEGAAVTFHLPDDGPTGVFFNGLRTEVSISDAQGRATLHGLIVNRTPGRFQIRVVASREQVRAGIVSFQYIAEPHSGAATTAAAAATPRAPRTAATRSRARWIVVAALVGGGAAAGILGAGRGSSASPPAPALPATLTIGPPVTTIGKP
jgi:hypothetical protein